MGLPWVRLTKEAERSDAVVASCPQESYLAGEVNLLSVPVSYWVEGFLLAELEVGKPLLLERHIRNGIKASGNFRSSLIVEIQGFKIKTLNSIYDLKPIAPCREATDADLA